jgi:transposase-like protein
MSTPKPQQRRAYWKFPTEDILAAIKAYHGNVSRIAEQFDVQRHQIYQRINTKQILKQALINERGFEGSS